jgi:DNA-binding CsgD family transcriptional regulator
LYGRKCLALRLDLKRVVFMAHQKLQLLFSAIAQTISEETLRTLFIDTIGHHFQSHRWGIYLYSPQGQFTSADTYGIRNVDAFLERYQSVGKSVDPVLKHVSTYHTPAHEGWFYTPEEWERSALYTRCCASMDHAHLMTGPIVGNGQMIGAVHFSRTSGTPAFTTQNLAELGAVCTHLSAQLAYFKPKLVTMNPAFHQLLTPRELQVAALVAQGLSNLAISQQLWISENTVKQSLKKIFRKLNVHNRAAMTHRLLG